MQHLASMILQVPVQSIWSAVFQLLSEQKCLDLELVNLRKIKRETLQRSMHFRDTIWHLEHLEYLSCGLAGTDSMEQRLHR